VTNEPERETRDLSITAIIESEISTGFYRLTTSTLSLALTLCLALSMEVTFSTLKTDLSFYILDTSASTFSTM
jgi:hypothetical protein